MTFFATEKELLKVVRRHGKCCPKPPLYFWLKTVLKTGLYFFCLSFFEKNLNKTGFPT
jgi:hypothetical protein